VWAQEEPVNQGAFSFVHKRVDHLLWKLGMNKFVAFVGRPASAASATGIMDEHNFEKQMFLNNLFNETHQNLLKKPVKII